ncbi:argininosuccinate lyase [Leptomonas seymouri]|uniref:Argininosuccinate lyase n=1 Tax=Leptomonas seymouri TaxID=5684 RepID=A0A0N1PA66_LEPSE|nr:argininosuccinate lyase [Leptomonas seymouri]|eukprot:KPI83025.1 argininosuccinate lyase [Leptomonas seymouri]
MVGHQKSLGGLSMGEFTSFSSAINDDVYNSISMETCAKDRKMVGGPAKEVSLTASENAKAFVTAEMSVRWTAALPL